MLELWTHLPRWLKFGMAAAVLGHSAYYALVRGIIWPWGIGIGGLLLVMSFMQPIGPPRPKVPPARLDSKPRPDSKPRRAENEESREQAARSRPGGGRRPTTLDDEWHRPLFRTGPDPKWALLGGLVVAVFAALVVAQMMRKI